MKTDEIKNEIYEMKKMRRKSWTERFEAGKYKYDFHKYETIMKAFILVKLVYAKLR